MTVESVISRNEIEDLQGRALVRRFTGELQGQTTLERATISALQEEDTIAEELMEARMRALLHDSDRDDAVFHAAETARLALLRTCKLFEAPEQVSKLAKIGINRKPARATATDALQGRVGHGFIQLSDYINCLDSTFKSKQGKSAQRFRSLCGGLDAHKSAFAIFPSQNNYASALCGSLTMIVSAAVNHDEIADTISETVTKITEKAARAAKILLVLHTRAIRELFSELYAQVFLFYRDAIEWYMKSKASRFFASFNEKMKDRYEKAAGNIEATVAEMYRENDIAHFALSRIQRTEQERRDEVFRQRQQTDDSFSLAYAGRNAQQLFLSSHRSACIDASMVNGVQICRDQEEADPPRTAKIVSSPVSRAATRELAGGLEKFVVGTEGHSLFNDGKFWVPEVDIASRLHDWIGPEAISPTLWISSPDISQFDGSGAHAAALNMLVVAWETEIPLISHFCERPRFATLPRDRDPEKVGLIGMVYSLISQLLQFSFEDDGFEAPPEAMTTFDGSDESWGQALDLFVTLLKATPHLALCVIDGLNDLAFNQGADWCHAFLKVLFEHQKSCTSVFRILLTTSGQSRVLQDYVDVDDRAFAQTGAREVIRGGRWVQSPDG